MILIIRALQDSTYRGVCDFPRASPGVCEVLGVRLVAHFTTLQKFADRENIVSLVDELIEELLEHLPIENDCEAVCGV